MIDIFVNAVYLYDDKLVITFNYKEASKTVTLKEVNGSIIECSGAPKNLVLRNEIFLSKPTGLVYHHDAVVYIIAKGVYHHTFRCVFLSAL